jgi:hypothetical protein
MRQEKKEKKKKMEGGLHVAHGGNLHLYQVFHSVQMCLPHLYRKACTGWIPGTNVRVTTGTNTCFPSSEISGETQRN